MTMYVRSVIMMTPSYETWLHFFISRPQDEVVVANHGDHHPLRAAAPAPHQGRVVVLPDADPVARRDLRRVPGPTLPVVGALVALRCPRLDTVGRSVRVDDGEGADLTALEPHCRGPNPRPLSPRTGGGARGEQSSAQSRRGGAGRRARSWRDKR